MRTETKESEKANTQFVVIDTKSMMCTEYDGKERIRTVHVGIDDETTREQLLPVIEELRQEATVASRAIEKQADEVQRVLEIRYGYADKEAASWFNT